MVFVRAGFGIFIALALGILFRLHPPKESVLFSGNGNNVISLCLRVRRRAGKRF
ncbi:MAG: hypothetical protein R2912_08625 [Eubacteriales bacterium]